MDDNQDSKDKVLFEYKERADKIIKQMFNVLMRAHRRVDDLEYRRILDKIHQV